MFVFHIVHIRNCFILCKMAGVAFGVSLGTINQSERTDYVVSQSGARIVLIDMTRHHTIIRVRYLIEAAVLRGEQF